jgi:hypothetical protein
MWKALGRGRVDGVLAVDVIALKAVLEQTGPITVAGDELDASDVVEEVLHDQYVGVPLEETAIAARRERLGELATAALRALDQRKWDAPALVRGLARAGAGRHVLAWSDDAREQDMWRAAGMSGAPAEGSLMLGVLNRNGTKLDQFIEADAALSVETGRRFNDCTLRLRLHNDTPKGEPPYIIGPHPLSDSKPAEYEGLVSVSVPGSARNVRVSGRRDVAVTGPDGPTRVIAVPVSIERGEEAAVDVRFELPPDLDSLTVLPSARIPPVRWRFRDEKWTDGLAKALLW